MKQELDLQDLEIIRESLAYTKLRFEEYDKYPDYETKVKRIREVELVINKILIMKKELHG